MVGGAAKLQSLDGGVARAAPSAARPGVPTSRAEALTEFRVLVQRLGGDPSALLERFQIEPTVLDRKSVV